MLAQIGSGPHIWRGIFFLLMWLVMVAGWIVLLVAVWRAMRAHEKIADSLRKIAEKEP